EFEISGIKDPIVKYPLQSNKIDMSNRDYINFSWQGDDKIDYYILEFYNSKTKKLLSRLKTKGNQFVFNDLFKLDEGKFYWTIQGFKKRQDGSTFKTELIKNEFIIYLSEKPDIPDLKTKDKIYIE
ncbi:MAG: hypothetical protein KDK36_08565, partial [Leptospiraceae bacterium]|nr:hypothetical protein [Leptospiraceae bacterium]